MWSVSAFMLILVGTIYTISFEVKTSQLAKQWLDG